MSRPISSRCEESDQSERIEERSKNLVLGEHEPLGNEVAGSSQSYIYLLATVRLG